MSEASEESGVQEQRSASSASSVTRPVAVCYCTFDFAQGKYVWYDSAGKPIQKTPKAPASGEGFHPEDEFDQDAVRIQWLSWLVKKRLETASEITADDIYAEAVERYPDNDPRWIGAVFAKLSHEGIIEVAGPPKKSVRTGTNHSRPIARWRLANREVVLQ